MVAPPRRAVPILPLAPLGGDSAWEGEARTNEAGKRPECVKPARKVDGFGLRYLLLRALVV
jgi:hypothetical protein